LGRRAARTYRRSWGSASMKHSPNFSGTYALEKLGECFVDAKPARGHDRLNSHGGIGIIQSLADEIGKRTIAVAQFRDHHEGRAADLGRHLRVEELPEPLACRIRHV